MNHGIAHEVLHRLETTSAVDDEKLLACEVGSPATSTYKEHIVIQAKYQPFWIYYYTTKKTYTRPDIKVTLSVKCKNYTAPVRSSTLTNLTTHPLPEEMLGVIASFEDEIVVECHSCGLIQFNMNLLEKCSAPIASDDPDTARQQFITTVKEVSKETGDHHACLAFESFDSPMLGQTLQSCMSLNDAPCRGCSEDERAFAVCKFESKSAYENLIKDKEEMIADLHKGIGKHRKDIDTHRRNMSNLEQIFEGL